jgi:hypothetical protein
MIEKVNYYKDFYLYLKKLQKTNEQFLCLKMGFIKEIFNQLIPNQQDASIWIVPNYQTDTLQIIIEFENSKKQKETEPKIIRMLDTLPELISNSLKIFSFYRIS